LNGPEFSAVRVFHRLFPAQGHMSMADATDAVVVANINNIAATRYIPCLRALDHDDEKCLDRHGRWGAACDRLFEDQPETTFDG
jgi:hypothetical protein